MSFLNLCAVGLLGKPAVKVESTQVAFAYSEGDLCGTGGLAPAICLALSSSCIYYILHLLFCISV